MIIYNEGGRKRDVIKVLEFIKTKWNSNIKSKELSHEMNISYNKIYDIIVSLLNLGILEKHGHIPNKRYYKLLDNNYEVYKLSEKVLFELRMKERWKKNRYKKDPNIETEESMERLLFIEYNGLLRITDLCKRWNIGYNGAFNWIDRRIKKGLLIRCDKNGKQIGRKVFVSISNEYSSIINREKKIVEKRKKIRGENSTEEFISKSVKHYVIGEKEQERMIVEDTGEETLTSILNNLKEETKNIEIDIYGRELDEFERGMINEYIKTEEIKEKSNKKMKAIHYCLLIDDLDIKSILKKEREEGKKNERYCQNDVE